MQCVVSVGCCMLKAVELAWFVVMKMVLVEMCWLVGRVVGCSLKVVCCMWKLVEMAWFVVMKLVLVEVCWLVAKVVSNMVY